MDSNLLYYGDNLSILRDYIPAESIDLVYLDPPFNSQREWNLIFQDESGKTPAISSRPRSRGDLNLSWACTHVP
jgi:DNA modification methylase